MAAQKRSKAPLVAAMIVGLLVVAGIAVLVLWLTMWRDDAGGSGEPVALAEQYISAMQAGDVDAYLDCFHEDFFQGEEMDWLKEMGMDLKQVMQMTMDMMDVSFKDYALELEYERGDEARVVTTGGTAVISIFGFEESFDLAEDPMVFEMVRKGGRWYLIDDPLPDSMGGDFDFDDFDDFDFDDFDDFDFGDFDLGDLGFDEADMESLLEILPDGYSLEDLENMSLDELMQLLEELQWLLEDLEDYLPYGAG